MGSVQILVTSLHMKEYQKANKLSMKKTYPYDGKQCRGGEAPHRGCRGVGGSWWTANRLILTGRKKENR